MVQKKTAKPNQFFIFFWKEIEVVIECNETLLMSDCARLMALHPHLVKPSASLLVPDIKITHDHDTANCTVEFAHWSIKTFTQKADVILYCTLAIGAAFLRKTKTLVLHAGGFILEGQAIVFVGASRVGKSTLAYEALKEGLPILGDDMITLNPFTHEVEAFPKPFKLRLSQTQNILNSNEYFTRYEYIFGNLEGEERVLLSRSSPGMLPLEKSYPIGAIVLLKRNDEYETTIKKLMGLEAIAAGLNQLIGTQSGSGLGILKTVRYLLNKQKIYQLNIRNWDTKNGLNLLLVNLKNQSK
jgi:hypothetical protein